MKNKTIKLLLAICVVSICIVSCKKHCEGKPNNHHKTTDTTSTVG
ncbi:MAG: hypothetical protein NTU43_09495 [Bacteroidetes bacterium]|nr:hypothetical protein [Bacteroidota bacterium]